MESLEGKFRDRNVIITGGLGFIGSNLAHRLVNLGSKVILVDSLNPDYGGNLFNIEDIKDKVKVNIADVRDKQSMEYLVKNQDYMFNLAAQVSHIDSMKDPYTDFEINARSQLSILEACRNNNPGIKIVFTSSRQVYGNPRYLPVDEEHPLQPTDVNGINKMSGEWYHILYNRVYGIKSVSLRMTNIYGLRQLVKHNKQGFIGWFIRQAIDGETIKIFGDGSQLRDFNFVDDAVEALLLSAAKDEANGEIFNLGHPEPISLLDLTKLLLKITNKGNYQIVPFPEEKKKIDIGSYYGKYDKIKNLLGWEPKVNLKEGLTKTIEYYQKFKEYYWQ